MRIIKEGNYEPKNHILTCNVCGCIFEVEESECKFEFCRNITYICVKCPFCNDEVWKNLE